MRAPLYARARGLLLYRAGTARAGYSYTARASAGSSSHGERRNFRVDRETAWADDTSIDSDRTAGTTQMEDSPMATTNTAKSTQKRGTRKPAGKSTQPAAPQTGRVRQQRTKDGLRQCAARPNGPYGINAPKQCTNATSRETAALCSTHEPMWRAESRRRMAAKGGAATSKSSKGSSNTRTAKTSKATVQSTDDLEAQLEASVKQARRPSNAQLREQRAAAVEAATTAEPVAAEG